MRHRRKSRVLGRSSSHRRALLSNLASSLFLTTTGLAGQSNAKVPGRIVTTLEKAKEVRPLVEKCITLAKNSLPSIEEANKYATSASRGSEDYKRWRSSESWVNWCNARTPFVNAKRKALSMLRDKRATEALFAYVGPMFVERPGGYTRIVRLAAPRLGDGGTRAVIELVGKNDRTRKASSKPDIDSSDI
jgi:large subunit ribosomal protein L17